MDIKVLILANQEMYEALNAGFEWWSDNNYVYNTYSAYNIDEAQYIIENKTIDVVIVMEDLGEMKTVISGIIIDNQTGLLFLKKIKKLCYNQVKILIKQNDIENTRDQINSQMLRYNLDKIFIGEIKIANLMDDIEEIIKARKTKMSLFFENGHALLIGADYNLPIVNQDVTAIYNFLVDENYAAYPKNQVQILKSEQATKNNILLSLDNLANQVINKREATVFVYYSGHGVQLNSKEYGLIPCDYNGSINYTISAECFTSKINAIKCQKFVLWLDCCHAQGMTKDVEIEVKDIGVESIVKSAPVPDQFIKKLSEGSGRIIVASCGQNEKSYADKNQSFFTSCLLEAMEGRQNSKSADQYVEFWEIWSYLQTEVNKRVKVSGKTQNPIIRKIEDMTSFPLCRRSIKQLTLNNEESIEQLSSKQQQSSSHIIRNTWEQDRQQYEMELLIIQNKLGRFRRERQITDSESKKIELDYKIKEAELEKKALIEEINNINQKLS